MCIRDRTEIDIVKNKEGERLLKNIKDDAYVFCLAIDGKQLDSVELSQKMDKPVSYTHL